MSKRIAFLLNSHFEQAEYADVDRLVITPKNNNT